MHVLESLKCLAENHTPNHLVHLFVGPLNSPLFDYRNEWLHLQRLSKLTSLEIELEGNESEMNSEERELQANFIHHFDPQSDKRIIATLASFTFTYNQHH